SQICKVLSLNARGLLTTEDLTSLKGYRPGFWNELLPFLEGDSARPVRQMTKLPLPKFFFDHTTARLGLIFPQEFVDKRLYYLDDRLVFESFLGLRNCADLADKFVGDAGEDRFEIDGWIPSEHSAFALFSENGVFCVPGRPVPPALYFLLAETSTKPPDGLRLLTDFE